MTRDLVRRAREAILVLLCSPTIALAEANPHFPSDPTLDEAKSREVFIARCVACHGADGFAPLRFNTTEAIVRHRQLMRALLEDGTMPPSDDTLSSDLKSSVVPAGDYAREHNHTQDMRGVISNSERSLLLAALASRDVTERTFAGIAEQIARDRALHFSNQPRGATRITTTAAYTVPASGGMHLRSFSVEVPTDAPRRVRGVRLSPIEHAERSPLRYLALAPDPERAWRVLDEHGTGADAMGDIGRTPSGALGAVSRTAPVFLLPKGYAFDLPRGDLVLEATVEPIGREASARPSVEFIAADERDTRTVRALAARVVPLVVGANKRVSRVVHIDVAAHRELVGVVVKGGVFLHGFSVEIIAADGCRTEIARSRDFRMSLARPLIFDTPLQLSQGSRIEVTFDLDNTSANPLQPFAPPRELRGGLPPDAEDAAIVLLVAQ